MLKLVWCDMLLREFLNEIKWCLNELEKSVVERAKINRLKSKAIEAKKERDNLLAEIKSKIRK